MSWKLSTDRQIWMQLTEVLTQRVVSGQYPPGIRIPSVRDLAAEAGVNPNTMQRALQQLERDGLVYTQRSSGRFVTEDTCIIDEAKKALAKQYIDQFIDSMKNLGYTREEIMELLKGSCEEDKNGNML